jgi:hypothetical protein
MRASDAPVMDSIAGQALTQPPQPWQRDAKTIGREATALQNAK